MIYSLDFLCCRARFPSFLCTFVRFITISALVTMTKTEQEYDQVTAVCRQLFVNKMKDYGPSWRILRPQSVTDQIYIKAKRIRTLEIAGESQVGDDIRGEFVAIIN